MAGPARPPTATSALCCAHPNGTTQTTTPAHLRHGEDQRIGVAQPLWQALHAVHGPHQHHLVRTCNVSPHQEQQQVNSSSNSSGGGGRRHSRSATRRRSGLAECGALGYSEISCAFTPEADQGTMVRTKFHLQRGGKQWFMEQCCRSCLCLLTRHMIAQAGLQNDCTATHAHQRQGVGPAALALCLLTWLAAASLQDSRMAKSSVVTLDSSSGWGPCAWQARAELGAAGAGRL